ncbi:hypothetical protein [uncultured Desulfobulbus sp.]|uniref:hypothetical protein n=1 Tax=uncultured Desulfobulbus sp. TaxID=239745 RepID=UPI0029C97DA1|nr:hypothetical protein [uncultured Desulfobulbus sp.]
MTNETAREAAQKAYDIVNDQKFLLGLMKDAALAFRDFRDWEGVKGISASIGHTEEALATVLETLKPLTENNQPTGDPAPGLTS